jgi:transcriptional regulator with XRE-family HTH domain
VPCLLFFLLRCDRKSDIAGQTPSQTFRRRLVDVRRRAKITQAELSSRLADLGYQLSRAAIAEIERGNRRVTLDDALAVAAALGVAPLHLIVPFEDEEPIMSPSPKPDEPGLTIFDSPDELRVGNLALIPSEARMWIKGEALYGGAEISHFARYYVEETPPPRRWNIDRAWDVNEGREPKGPPAHEESRPKMAAIREGQIVPVHPGFWVLLREEEK